MQKLTDVQFINSPLEWPMYPVLPLKNPKDFRKEGFIFSGQPNIVYHENIFGIKAKTGTSWKDILSKLEKTEYDSVETLLKEWQID